MWHNPDVVVGPRTAAGRGTADARPRVVVAQAEGRGRGRRPATPEAPSVERPTASTPPPGFAPRDSRPPTAPPASKPEPRSQRIIAAAGPPTDPKVLERERLLSRLVTAEGRPAITRAADAFVAAGFELPDDQTVQLQMLEHSREAYVQTAIDKLATLLAAEPCKRLTVLESRLRRLEEFADEPDLRASARELRRQVRGREASASDRTPKPAAVAIDDDA